MTRNMAYKAFKRIVAYAAREIVRFTTEHKLDVSKKADRTLATSCDKHLDECLGSIAHEATGLPVVSEESPVAMDVIQKGTYITIDPIDGSLGYIEHVNKAIENNRIDDFLSDNIPPGYDFCLLLGIVIDAQPRYACCYHYITKEVMLLDAKHPNKCQFTKGSRYYSAPAACYTDLRENSNAQHKILLTPGVQKIVQPPFGFKSVSTILNNHTDAVMVHRAQSAGLWDILPVAVAARAFGGKVYDDHGQDICFDQYAMVPGNGATVIKGDRFSWVLKEL